MSNTPAQTPLPPRPPRSLPSVPLLALLPLLLLLCLTSNRNSHGYFDPRQSNNDPSCNKTRIPGDRAHRKTTRRQPTHLLLRWLP